MSCATAILLGFPSLFLHIAEETCQRLQADAHIIMPCLAHWWRSFS